MEKLRIGAATMVIYVKSEGHNGLIQIQLEVWPLIYAILLGRTWLWTITKTVHWLRRSILFGKNPSVLRIHNKVCRSRTCSSGIEAMDIGMGKINFGSERGMPDTIPVEMRGWTGPNNSLTQMAPHPLKHLFVSTSGTINKKVPAGAHQCEAKI